MERGRAGESNVSTVPRPGVKRVYEPPAASDGTRVLVDRIWPRGLTKERASVDVWRIAPSACLRTWFGHKPEALA